MKTRSATSISNRNLFQTYKTSTGAEGIKRSRTALFCMVMDSQDSKSALIDTEATSPCDSAPVSINSDADIEYEPIMDEITSGDYDSNAETESDSDDEEPCMLFPNFKKRKSKAKKKKKAKKPLYDDNIAGICIAPRSSPVITEQIELKIKTALSLPPATKLVEKNFKVMTPELLKMYQPGEWLEDEGIDFYLGLIGERNNSGKDPSLPKIYCFPCYFFVMLNRIGYESIRSFTDGINIFEFEILFIPIGMGKHWRLIAIDFKNQSIIAYDSLARKNPVVLEKLKNYLDSEYNKLVKKSGVSAEIRQMLYGVEPKTLNTNTMSGSEYPESADSGYTEIKTKNFPQPQAQTFLQHWLIEHASKENVPQQSNEHDCGVFLCQFAESLARRVPPPFDFTQQNMPHFRQLMAYETLSGELVPRCSSGTEL